MKRGKTYARITAISRGMAILDHLASRPEGTTVSQLSSALEIEISIVSRALSTFESDGYVRRSATGERFVIGFALADLVYEQLSRLKLPDMFVPALRKLADSVHEMAQLAIVDGDILQYVAIAQVNRRVTLRGLIGQVARPDTMATGKAWIAWLDEERSHRAVRNGRGDGSVRGDSLAPELVNELADVRRFGYAIEVDATITDVAAIASPVWAGEPKSVVAVVAIAGPSYRLDRARLAAMSQTLFACADDISGLWPAVVLSKHVRGDRHHLEHDDFLAHEALP